MSALFQYLLNQARKASVAFGGTLVAAVVAGGPAILADGKIEGDEVAKLIGGAVTLAILAAFAVWAAPNKPAASVPVAPKP